MFTLNTMLIPALKGNGITFRYIDGVYSTTTIIITHKNLDICRVDVNRNSNEPYNYCVYWFNSVLDFISCRRDKYALSKNLIDDIKIAIKCLENGRESKMNKKMYRVSDVEFKSSPSQMDEMTFTVNVLNSNCAIREDCDRIREAIESIEKEEYPKDIKWEIRDYHGGFTTWRNEYQKERDKFEIKDVIFNDPATIVLWEDGTKTVVKAENEPFDPEKGLAMAISKRALGDKYNYYDAFKKYVGRYEKKQKKGGK